MTCGPKFCPECQNELNERLSSNGLSRNRSSTQRESWEAWILLISMIKSSRTPSKMPGQSWQFQRKPPCLVSWRRRRARTGIGEPTANPTKSKIKACMHRRSSAERTPSKDYEDHVAEKGFNSLSHYNLRPYRLPDENIITVGAERFHCAEVLYQPSFIGKEACGFHDASFLSFMKLDADVRKN